MMRPTIPTRALGAAIAAAVIAQVPLAAQQFPSSPPPPAPIRAAQFPPFKEATLTNGVHLLLV